MKFGVCAETNVGGLAKEIGFEFIELNVQSHLKPDKSEEEFAPALAKIRACTLPCLAANCFIPGGLKLCGPEIKKDEIEKYVKTACERANRAGIKVIVFGSGGARRIPDGFAREKAWAQLVEFGRLAGREAAKNGVMIVAEPLNTAECNVLTTAVEGGKYVRDVNHSNMKLLVDAYHWNKESEKEEDLEKLAPLVRHAHIGTYTSRLAPGGEPCDFSPFFSALKKGGYDGTMSIEGKWALYKCGFALNIESDPSIASNTEPVKKAIEILRTQAAT